MKAAALFKGLNIAGQARVAAILAIYILALPKKKKRRVRRGDSL